MSNLPFVLFRTPGTTTIQAIYQNDKAVVLLEHYKQSGFVFAPFDLQNNAVLVRADGKEKYHWEKPKDPITDTANFRAGEKSKHINLLKKGIEAIEAGKLKKVVLSRKIAIPGQKEPFRIFEDLLSQYSDALVYFFYHPGVGIWLGATPERFLEINKGELVTTSLAGTLPITTGIAPKWSGKELKEQQIVTDFLMNTLNRYASDLEFAPVKTVKAGKLWHLKTDIRAKGVALEDWEAIILGLHPTPAVCGVPKASAMRFILDNESYPREFYTGFLGGLNLNDEEEIQLYVNLRCMKITTNMAYVFVGGGITMDSDPENEWLETQYKSLTMLAVL